MSDHRNPVEAAILPPRRRPGKRPAAPPDPATCPHPASRRYVWVARDPETPSGHTVCIGCCACGKVLAGGVRLEDAE